MRTMPNIGRKKLNLSFFKSKSQLDLGRSNATFISITLFQFCFKVGASDRLRKHQ